MPKPDLDIPSQVFNLTVKHPWRFITPWALFFALAVTTLFDFATLQPQITIASDMTSLAPMRGAELERFQKAKNLFGDDDVLLVAWTGENLFSAASLKGLKNFTQELEAMRSVRLVRSLANAIDIKELEDGIQVDKYLHEIPTETNELIALRERALNDPLVAGQLVGANGNALLTLIQFNADHTSPDWQQILTSVEHRCAQHAGAATCYLSGPLFVRVKIGQILLNDLFRVVPAAMLATLLVGFIGLRDFRGAAICLLSNAIITAIVLAAFNAAGMRLNFITVMLAPVIYVVGFAYSMHVVCASAEAVRQSDIPLGLQKLVRPLSVTVATTAFAFAAIAISEFSAIQSFGLWACVGIITAGIAALTLVPALIVVLNAWGRRHPLCVAAASKSLARYAQNKCRAIAVFVTVLLAASVWSISNISVDTAILSNFKDESNIRRNFEAIAHNFNGPVPINIVLDGGRPDAFKDPARLTTMQSLIRCLEQQNEIGGAVGLSSVVARLHQAFVPEAGFGSVPSSENLVNQLLLSGGNSADLFAEPSYQFALVHVQSKTLSTAAVNDVVKRIEARLAELPNDISGRVTGTTSLAARSVAALTNGQLQSLMLAMLGVWVMLSVLFRSAKIGFIALIPNMLPVVAYFALLGALGISLNLTTSLVACAVFGIAIDDSVHLITRFRIAADNERAAPIEDALRHTLYPISLTTAALAAGFLTLTQAELASQGEFGVLAAATLVIAWCIDVIVTPALCAFLVRNA
ncbi:MAG: MMPL family transporter [Pseudomonadota bacterium]